LAALDATTAGWVALAKASEALAAAPCNGEIQRWFCDAIDRLCDALMRSAEHGDALAVSSGRGPAAEPAEALDTACIPTELPGEFGAEVLHVYGQPGWHDKAYISGGCHALMALRRAIDSALAAGREGPTELEVFTSDGEGYLLQVVAMADEDAARQVVPYTEAPAARPWADAFGPWDAALRSSEAD